MTRKKILIVEDSPVQALSLLRLLEKYDVDVKWALDGRIGVDMAHHFLPDLIVLDVEMPRMNGIEACQRLKKSEVTSDIPVVLFTAHDEQESVILGLQLGAVDFIPKDVFADVVLMETIRQMGLIPESELAAA
jgi:CheY-like chemotaxis protein